MPTLCIVLANYLCNTHRSGFYVVPSRRGRNLIVLRAKVRMAEGHPKPDEGGFVHSYYVCSAYHTETPEKNKEARNWQGLTGGCLPPCRRLPPSVFHGIF